MGPAYAGTTINGIAGLLCPQPLSMIAPHRHEILAAHIIVRRATAMTFMIPAFSYFTHMTCRPSGKVTVRLHRIGKVKCAGVP
jgi:hypothetical protein